MDRMSSRPYASAPGRATTRAAAKNVADQTIQIVNKAGAPGMKPAASSAKPLACITQAKHKRLIEILDDLRVGAEALSVNADSLLSRLS